MQSRNARLAVAPMMDWTDRHYRYFARLLTRHTLLYTEMVTTGALIHGDTARFLRHDPAEHPVALQLGGADPAEMAHCARLGADAGFCEVNINVGCPSDRVQNGRFGACLMAEPDVVANCVAAMKAAVAVPVTVKTRIGIDERDSYEALAAFTDAVANAGCDALIVHARKAWLQGLSPRENRDVPPLRYDVVLRLKQDFPDLAIVINGGLQTLAQAAGFLERLDGAMIGRAAYQTPWLLADADRVIFSDPTPPPTPHEVLDAFVPYVEREFAAGVPLNAITRHILGLFQGRPGARRWRRHLSEQAHKPGAGIEVLRDATRRVQ
ncbi:tRNA dihydrouridine(20/20a) synthase DusA [Thiohalocapsa halophila]|uniref:tRNA-dihydrouridine(20/20a) synthase n=1 Tax=Thiohalocapsa halophila TaxID=69359 RepID=A0ABS1CGB6_9GAMM|nr:tRNA dihydrouridine(20/20a) synthase DusA [Thiohalocapsa halophila]MBK1630416.1 tRNA dihydrouridine(20/20a) synthase DusA [Thiohalocapsa halophila]